MYVCGTGILGDLILRVCTFTKCKCVINHFLSLPLSYFLLPHPHPFPSSFLSLLLPFPPHPFPSSSFSLLLLSYLIPFPPPPFPSSSLSLLLLLPPPPLLPLTPSQAMLLFTGSAVFSSELSSTFKRLAEDENSKVRRTVASGFHEVRGEREGWREGGREGGREGEKEGGRKGKEKGRRRGKKVRRKKEERDKKQKVWSQQQISLTSQVTKLLETNCFSVAYCYQQLLKDPSVEVCTFQFFFKVG